LPITVDGRCEVNSERRQGAICARVVQTETADTVSSSTCHLCVNILSSPLTACHRCHCPWFHNRQAHTHCNWVAHGKLLSFTVTDISISQGNVATHLRSDEINQSVILPDIKAHKPT